MTADYLLHESAVGYAVFRVLHQQDAVGVRLQEVQHKVRDLSTFGKMVELVSFAPFRDTQQALENANDISEGIVSEYLRTTLEAALPKASKKSKVTLGVLDKNLAGSVKAEFPGLECETAETSEVVADLLRGLREHGPKLIKKLHDGDIFRSQLGLGHSYSRAKVKFSIQKNDNHVMQAIATLDQLDKAVNTFCMRVREWYSWHFPELVKIVSENRAYAKLVVFIGDKSQLSDEKLDDLTELVDNDESTAREIISAARVSMGRDLSEADMENVIEFAKRAVKLATYRKQLADYLSRKMEVVAPNLKALIGDVIAARLISKAGSLTNLSKMPASTVPILGAEKALFRALKTKGNTPKYGLIYHSSFIGRSGVKNKGRISRYVANKCSIASRIDCFSENPTSKFGEALKQQVEDRLEFYASGKPPQKNSIVMEDAMNAVLGDINADVATTEAAEDVEMADDEAATELALRIRKGKKGEKDKSEKKKDKEERKKEKRRKHDAEVDGEKKKKKKSKHE